ncbi:MAG: hypothetical protein ARM1_0303 [Candidatus Micrarchaeota archaeon]|nr:MAG: hypothetical protein ARM1_0303 [Candidatus Micrarchaeota archaeon]
MLDQDRTDYIIAYRYPFSKYAKELISASSISMSEQLLSRSFDELIGILNNHYPKESQSIDIRSVTEFLTRYAVERAILSYYRDPTAISLFSEFHSKRSLDIYFNNTKDMDLISDDLGISSYHRSANLNVIKVAEFLNNKSSSNNRLSLKYMNIRRGLVYLEDALFDIFLKDAFYNAVSKGLPISKDLIPKEIMQFCSRNRLSYKINYSIKQIKSVKGKGSIEWIERLLNIPIPDGRHRVVNLILAPYLVNVKALDIEEAVSIIRDYIERCKALNNTSITESYIRYQCKYAKQKGLKPLSKAKAIELLSQFIDTSGIFNEKADKA